MKTETTMDPSAAFPDAQHMPRTAELAAVLGAAFTPIGLILDRLHALHPEAACAWQFSPRCGWYQVQVLKKRRLLYLIPRRGDFRLSLLLGGKALAQLRAGPFGKRVAKLLKTAKRYPEGTAFDFDRTTADPDLLAAFIDAKIDPEVRRPDPPRRVPTKSRQARAQRPRPS